MEKYAFKSHHYFRFVHSLLRPQNNALNFLSVFICKGKMAFPMLIYWNPNYSLKSRNRCKEGNIYKGLVTLACAFLFLWSLACRHRTARKPWSVCYRWVHTEYCVFSPKAVIRNHEHSVKTAVTCFCLQESLRKRMTQRCLTFRPYHLGSIRASSRLFHQKTRRTRKDSENFGESTYFV